MQQYNETLNCNNRVLDLVLSNLPCSIAVTHDSDPLVPEDIYHPALSISFTLTTTEPIRSFSSNTNLRYNFKNANFQSLYDSIISIDWTSIDTFSNVNDAISEFYDLLFNTIRLFVPTSRSPQRNFPPWINSDIKRNLKIKQYYYNKWKKTNSSVYRVEFSRLRSLTKRQIKTAYNEYHRTIENNITSNPKLFWKFVNAKRSSSRIPGSMKMHDVTLEKPSDIVQAFADSFSDVFTRHTSVTSNHDNSDFNSCSFNIGYFTTPEVLRALNKLKATMVSGHDGLPSFLLHDCAPILCEPLCSIFNLAVRTSTFPTCWKISRITRFLRKAIKVISIITDQLVFYLIAPKYLNSFSMRDFITQSSHISLSINTALFEGGQQLVI